MILNARSKNWKFPQYWKLNPQQASPTRWMKIQPNIGAVCNRKHPIPELFATENRKTRGHGLQLCGNLTETEASSTHPLNHCKLISQGTHTSLSSPTCKRWIACFQLRWRSLRKIARVWVERKRKKVRRKREILEVIDCFTWKRWQQEGV